MNASTQFVTYAQNNEDVMLFRALRHIQIGFYVDVGAAHPSRLSVTKAFYDRGWSGVNIEPSPEFFELLEKERERDANYNCAILSTEGEAEFWEVEALETSTVNAELGQQYEEGSQRVTKRAVKCRPLSSITKEITVDEVHFLKIDVEESEKQVLESVDFSQFRPWIILVEATVPNTAIPNHEAWEELITSNRYRFVYFDGLNRFYVAEEHAELAEAFSTPPGVFDSFITASECSLWTENYQLKERLGKMEDDRTHLLGVIRQLSSSPPENMAALQPEAAASNSIEEGSESPEQPNSQLEDTCRELRDIILDRDAEILELAEMNLRLLKSTPETKGFFQAIAQSLPGIQKDGAIPTEELQRRISSLRLEIKQRFQAADETWLRQL